MQKSYGVKPAAADTGPTVTSSVAICAENLLTNGAVSAAERVRLIDMRPSWGWLSGTVAAGFVAITGTIELQDERTERISAHGSTYQDAKAALERTISEGCALVIALE